MSTTTERTRATLIKEGDREESGAYPVEERLQSEALIAELAPELVELIPEPPPESRRPRPRPATPSERAELVLEDLSLAPDNPYLASSLVPPPKRPFPVRRALGIAGGMLAAASLGAAIQLLVLRASHEQGTQGTGGAVAAAPVPVAVAAPAAPVPVLPAEPGANAAPPPQPAPEPSAPAVAPAPDAKLATEGAVRAPRVVSAPPPAPPEPEATALEVPAVVSVAPVDLPDWPTREQVTAGFESVRAALVQCAAGRAGTAEIKATISNDGRISYALVRGDYDGSAEGTCMAKAVRAAQFPPFAQPRLKVSYPIALR